MNPIVAHPRPAQEEQRAAIRRELSAKYGAELRAAGLLRRWLIQLRIEREVTAELKRRFPPGALYGAAVLLRRG